MVVISNRCYARVGLMGNPSDCFEGKVLAECIENFYAEATLSTMGCQKYANIITESPIRSFECVHVRVRVNGLSISVVLGNAGMRICNTIL